MQALHFAGEEDRSMFIPLMAPFRAMSTMVPELQWPRRRCQVSTSGVRDAQKAEGVDAGRGISELALEVLWRLRT